MLLPCTCKNDFQDKMYGKGTRVHTEPSKAGKTSKGPCCTVCEKRK